MNRKHSEKPKRFATPAEKQAEIDRLAAEINRHFHFYEAAPISEKERKIREAERLVDACFFTPTTA